ncbi:MAG: aminoacyl--tRNA ligase-related protein [Patescibacteria group bacterium]
MRYSKLFGKTNKTAPEDEKIISNKLLYQAGYIRESTAGRYFFLPLGQIVQRKIMLVIKEEMDQTGAQEMISPVLHPLTLWQETNRDKSAGFELMKIKDRHDTEFILGGTAEEMFIDVVRKFQISYRDLPFNIYQFSAKFRDELRARGGLLRVREFMMKDAYSFHADEECFKKEYQLMADTYIKIFKRLGLKTYIVESDNGYIGGDYCHEFIVESPVGESRFLMTEDESYSAHEDVAVFDTTQAGRFAKNGKKLIEKKGIEVGNIFQLGYYYSYKMKDATFVDKNDKNQPYYMGCYGIGIGRTMATVVEIHHDDKGIIWPEEIAPYKIHLLALGKDPKVLEQTTKLYDKFCKENVEVLFDDRMNIMAGEKFADADLIGIPYRIVVSEKTLKASGVEIKQRDSQEQKIVKMDQVIKMFKS